jgi:hypothetical protein
MTIAILKIQNAAHQYEIALFLNGDLIAGSTKASPFGMHTKEQVSALSLILQQSTPFAFKEINIKSFEEHLSFDHFGEALNKHKKADEKTTFSYLDFDIHVDDLRFILSNSARELEKSEKAYRDLYNEHKPANTM